MEERGREKEEKRWAMLKNRERKKGKVGERETIKRVRERSKKGKAIILRFSMDYPLKITPQPEEIDFFNKSSRSISKRKLVLIQFSLIVTL